MAGGERCRRHPSYESYESYASFWWQAHLPFFDELERQFASEFDYTVEARNLDTVRTSIRPVAITPQPRRNHAATTPQPRSSHAAATPQPRRNHAAITPQSRCDQIASAA